MDQSSTEAMRHNSYDPKLYQSLFEVEDRHLWFRARNRVIVAVVEHLVSGLAPGYRVLEVGCGTGNVLRVLRDICSDGIVIGMDLFSEGLTFARERTTAALVQGDMHHPPFATGKFDIIGLFDVLEHLPDDMAVLGDLHSLLTDHGALLLTVPAHPVLWSYFDEASCHCRRYLPGELRAKLTEAGYRLEYLTQYMAAIFPLVWIGRRLAALAGRSVGAQAAGVNALAERELRIDPFINSLLAGILGWEVHFLAHRRRLPFGTSLLAIALKT